MGMGVPGGVCAVAGCGSTRAGGYTGPAHHERGVWFPSTGSGQALRAAGDGGPAQHERGWAGFSRTEGGDPVGASGWWVGRAPLEIVPAGTHKGYPCTIPRACVGGGWFRGRVGIRGGLNGLRHRGFEFVIPGRRRR